MPFAHGSSVPPVTKTVCPLGDDVCFIFLPPGYMVYMTNDYSQTSPMNYSANMVKGFEQT